jgi:hypothetical protein
MWVLGRVWESAAVPVGHDHRRCVLHIIHLLIQLPLSPLSNHELKDFLKIDGLDTPVSPTKGERRLHRNHQRPSCDAGTSGIHLSSNLQGNASFSSVTMTGSGKEPLTNYAPKLRFQLTLRDGNSGWQYTVP